MLTALILIGLTVHPLSLHHRTVAAPGGSICPNSLTTSRVEATEQWRPPYYQSCLHKYSNLRLSVTNSGCFARGYTDRWGCGTCEPTVNTEFPPGTGISYLGSGALWIGSIVGLDTLVSTGFGPMLDPGG